MLTSQRLTRGRPETRTDHQCTFAESGLSMSRETQPSPSQGSAEGHALAREPSPANASIFLSYSSSTLSVECPLLSSTWHPRQTRICNGLNKQSPYPRHAFLLLSGEKIAIAHLPSSSPVYSRSVLLKSLVWKHRLSGLAGKSGLRTNDLWSFPTSSPPAWS